MDLAILLLGVQYFPQIYLALNNAETETNLMAKWQLTEKVSGMVTDGAHNTGMVERERGCFYSSSYTFCSSTFFILLCTRVVNKSIAQTPD